MSVGIVHDQELVWARGFGLADEERTVPAAPDTVYRIASISKLFTATAVMQLAERGLLSLDGDVNAYLSRFKLADRYPQPVTVAHLLTHSHGFDASVRSHTAHHTPTKSARMQRAAPASAVPEPRRTATTTALVAHAGIVEAVHDLAANEPIIAGQFLGGQMLLHDATSWASTSASPRSTTGPWTRRPTASVGMPPAMLPRRAGLFSWTCRGKPPPAGFGTASLLPVGGPRSIRSAGRSPQGKLRPRGGCAVVGDLRNGPF